MKALFFDEIIESIGKILTTLKGIKDIPKAKRAEIRNALGDNFIMLNSTLNMIIIRLGEVYRIQDRLDFTQEVEQLGFGQTWLDSERAFRLCESLKHGLREWQTLDQSLINLVSIKNWEELKLQMENILKNESELAYFIEDNFRELANTLRNNPDDMNFLKQEIQSLQQLLNTERRKLIELENKMYDFL